MHYDITSLQRINELKRLITGSKAKQAKSDQVGDDLDRPMTEEELAVIVDYNLQNL